MRSAMSVGEIERELARLRVREDGPSGARASVLNLIAVTSEEAATEVARVISDLSDRHPYRAILIISDPDERKANLEVSLSSSCGTGRGEGQVCAEQITIHAEGPPAEHLESLAGPLLLPNLPVFLWYPDGLLPDPPAGVVALADRLILDSGAVEGREAFLRAAADLCREGLPAAGDLQWAALSPWRALVADLFTGPERTGGLGDIERVEVLHGPVGGCRALLLAGWLSSALGWLPERTSRTEGSRELVLSGPSGTVTVGLADDLSGDALTRVRIFSGDLTFEVRVSRGEDPAGVRATVTRGGKVLGERAVHLGSSGTSALLGEELRVPGRDGAYEAALLRAVEMLDS